MMKIELKNRKLSDGSEVWSVRLSSDELVHLEIPAACEDSAKEALELFRQAMNAAKGY